MRTLLAITLCTLLAGCTITNGLGVDAPSDGKVDAITVVPVLITGEYYK